MRQQWRNLLFLHWAWDPADIAKTLPPGLQVDCFDGRAYLGVVPFFMCGVRPSFFPAVPGISNFLELNLRTYVRDERGRPGVWFYSLDCNQFFAVKVARRFFHLPYEHAAMTARKGADEKVRDYFCRRAGQSLEARFTYAAADESFARSSSGSLEEFFVERYRLFAFGDGRLYEGEVWHEPYEICRADVREWSAVPILQAGFQFPAGEIPPPEHSHYALGVDVRIFPLRRARQRPQP
jgi:uncharacterized protein